MTRLPLRASAPAPPRTRRLAVSCKQRLHRRRRARRARPARPAAPSGFTCRAAAVPRGRGPTRRLPRPRDAALARRRALRRGSARRAHAPPASARCSRARLRRRAGRLRLSQFAYEGNVYEGWPVYVTTDATYHAWHLVFDKVLRDLEQEALLPKLEHLVAGLVAARQRRPARSPAHAARDAAVPRRAALPGRGRRARAAAPLGPLARRRRPSSTRTRGGSRRSSASTSTTRCSRRAGTTRAPRSCAGSSRRCPCSASPLLPARHAGLPRRRAGAAGAPRRPLASSSTRRSSRCGGRSTSRPRSWSASPTTTRRSRSPRRRPRAPEPRAADDAAVRRPRRSARRARSGSTPSARRSAFMGTRFVIDSFVLDQLVSPTSAPPRSRACSLGARPRRAFGSTSPRTRWRPPARPTTRTTTPSSRRPARSRPARRPPGAARSTTPGSTRCSRCSRRTARLPRLHALGGVGGEGSPDRPRLLHRAEARHDPVRQAGVAEARRRAASHPPNWVEPEPAAFERLAAAADLMRAAWPGAGC